MTRGAYFAVLAPHTPLADLFWSGKNVWDDEQYLLIGAQVERIQQSLAMLL